MSTLRVSNIEAKADPSSPSVDEKLKVTNSNGDVLIHIDGKTAGITTVGINTTDKSFTVDAAQNVEFLGIVTATKFSLSGGGEITGGDGNFTGIVTSGSGNFTGGLSVGTAVTAATANFTSSLTAASANFTGNVSIAGTLTYEDVTNVDSIGIATARTGIDVTGGHIDLIDNSKIRVGTGDDLQIYHDGSNSYVQDTGTGGLKITGSDVYIRNTSDQDMIHASSGSFVKLYHNNSTKFETTTTGAKVTGALEVTQEYPSIRPILDLNFAATKTLDRRITFTRDSLGTYVDDMGIVRYASNNVPRFDHDPTTSESLGLLIEESRTNDVAHSDPGNAVWLPDNGAVKTVNTTDTKAPDGSFTALKLASQATGSSTSQIYDTFSKSSGGVQSIWAKKGTNNVLGIFDFQGSSGIRGWFDLNTGEHRCEGGSKVAAGVQSNGNDTNNTNMIEYPNGWYRCIYYESGNMTYAHFRIVDFDSDSEASSSSNTIYLWGAQAEVNKTFATSFIPSLSATMPATNSTRAQDTAKITGTNFTDFYNQTEGTVFSSHQQYSGQSDTQNTYVYQIASNNSVSVGFRLIDKNQYYSSPARLSATQWTNDVLMQKPDATNGERIKTAFACKVNDAAVSYDGATVLTDTSLDMNSGQTNMSIGMYPTSPQGFLNGHIQQISYYNKRLPNAQLQGLTQQ